MLKLHHFQTTEINGLFVSPLKLWGRLIGVGDPEPATNAELEIEIDVENQVGTLSAGAQLIGATNGVTYLTIADVLLNAATVTATIRAVSDQTGGSGKGAIGNLENGTIISFANPLANVNRETVVTNTITTGANAETEDAYRDRVVDRFQKVPQGGAYADYEQWSEEAAGIINAYPYSGEIPGQVDVYLEATVASSGNEDGIPTEAQLQEVLDDHINLDQNGLASRSPANALVNTLPISRAEFEVAVTGIADVDNLASTQESIETSLNQYFVDREPFIVGLTIPPRKDRVNNSAVGGVVEDIVSAQGGIFSSTSVTRKNVESLTNSVYTGDSESIAAQETDIQDFKFYQDGLKAFIIGTGAVLYEYDLSTAYDITTLSYSGNSYDVSTEVATPRAFEFNQDGTGLFVVGDSAFIYAYDVSTAFDLSSTITPQVVPLDISDRESAPKALVFDMTGYDMFIVGDNAIVYNYHLLTPYKIITATYSGFKYDVSGTTPDPSSLIFTERGKKMTLLDSGGVFVDYVLGIPYDITYGVDISFDGYGVQGQDNSPVSIQFNEDKSEFIIAGNQNNSLFKYQTGVEDIGLSNIAYTLSKGEKAKLLTVVFD